MKTNLKEFKINNTKVQSRTIALMMDFEIFNKNR